ncbi:hypothetical protein [Cupriavidus gilardii]|uniref:hypothetical protein n=1 Tax=Cupriavidus gilardii TaxID=82541 RepID=UPI0021B1A14D|nr:hypothetical protein [Cupriavidus gilardii]UXC37323.1 hypothetical protein N4G38_07770 [Cupriavidus gilardii]
MSVKFDDFLTIAARDAAGSTEIEWRNGASRAYYAGYHRALESVGACPDNSHLRMGDHERVHARFDLVGTTAAKSISYVLQSMKRTRRQADYELGTRFAKHDAEKQVHTVASLKDKLDAFDASVTGSQATA